MSAGDAGADIRAMEALEAKVSDLSAAQVRLEARVDALEESAGPSPEDDGPAQAKVTGLVAAQVRLEARVDALENPESAMDGAHAGLEELTAKLPHYAESLTKAQVAERARAKDSNVK